MMDVQRIRATSVHTMMHGRKMPAGFSDFRQRSKPVAPTTSNMRS
jgi:hypothetical protein